MTGNKDIITWQQMQAFDSFENGIDWLEHRAFLKCIVGWDFDDAWENERHHPDVFSKAAARRFEPSRDSGLFVGLALCERAMGACVAFKAGNMMM
ncbi:MAG TPA: hypothetical protein VEH04_04255 [Verrucomicrobiae bacterium]|nr:hypothetical protein [Verrucomicrobiae bacterium]